MSEVLVSERNPAGDIWLNLYPKNRSQSKANIQKCLTYDKALSAIKNLHFALWKCEGSVVLSEKKFRRLYEDFSDNVENNLVALRFFYRGIFRGNELKRWELPLPPLPMKIPREKNTISVKSFANEFLPRQQLTSSFLKTLEDEVPKTAEKRLTQVLLSAILFGGLVQKDWIGPWIKALEEDVNLLKKTLWLDMETTEKTDWQSPQDQGAHKDKVRRRWVADSLTQLLMVRWFKDFLGERRNLKSIDPWKSIKSFLSEILEKGVSQPRTLDELLRWARAGLRMSVPPYLAAYACGDLYAVSLPEKTWLRVATGKKFLVKRPPKEAGFISSDSVQKHLRKEKKQGDFDQESLLKDLIKQINLADAGKLVFNEEQTEILDEALKKKLTPVQQAIAIFFSQNKKKMVPVLQDLCKWAIHLLEKPRPQHRHFHYQKLVPSSVDRYLHSIGFGLISHLDDEELEDFDPGDLEKIYEDVIESHGSFKERRYCLVPLTRFHGYVRHFNNVSGSDLLVLSKRGKLADSIDANILLPSSYKRVLGYLGIHNKHQERLERMQIIALLLGYRCGMRRSEIRGLRLADIEPGARSLLKIRRTSRRRLKSRSSSRRLPLKDLLTEQEYKNLQTWRDERIKESSGQIDSLFLCETDAPYEPMKPERLFSPITEALQEATGDETFRFHHLRHSFAQLHLVNMDSQVQRGDAAWLKHDLPPFCAEPKRLGRGNLYAISALLGHSSPETTMRHYIHVADFMLGMALRAREVEPVLTIKAVLSLTSPPKSTVYYHYDKKTKGWRCPLVQWFKCDESLSETLKPSLLSEAQLISWTRQGLKARKHNLPSWEDALENAYQMVDRDPCADLSFKMTEAQFMMAGHFYRNLSNLSSAVFSSTCASLLYGFNSCLDQEGTSAKSFIFGSVNELLTFVKAMNWIVAGTTAKVFVSGVHADRDEIVLTLPLERSQWNVIRSQKNLPLLTKGETKFEVIPEWQIEKSSGDPQEVVGKAKSLAPGFLMFLFVLRCWIDPSRTPTPLDLEGEL